MVTLKIGLVGSSQLSFPGDKAGRFARSAAELADLAKQFRVELYVYPDSVITEEDAETAVRTIEKNRVDFLLWQTTSYSAGQLVPVFAKADVMGLGLWAIPEGTDNGVMPLNSFCSINMYSGIIGHYLGRYAKKFKWFFGDKGHPFFDERLRVTVAALRCIKRLKASRLALIGGVAPGFNDLLFDEAKLLHLFDGMKLNRLHEFAELKKRALSYPSDQIAALAESMSGCARCVHPKAAPLMETNARFYRAYTDFVKENQYDGVAVSCWPAFGEQFEFSVCAVLGQLNEEGTVAACEGDLVSAVCMLMLRYLSESAVTLMDLVNFDETDQSVLLWHCGPTAKQFCQNYDLDLNYSGRPHEFGMADPFGNGVTRDMVFNPGIATVARLDASLDKMLMLSGSFLDREKPSHKGSRGWMDTLRMNGRPVVVRDLINTVIASRFPHHYPVVYGSYEKEIMEICAWLGLGQVEEIPYEDYFM
ncbi:MAG: hypothetical protein LBR76_04180 [Oscillospiraceae bacterium]|jgi:hypothetical protein|nr:hypothetical protein [Oscillospiraceae bacterium]